MPKCDFNEVALQLYWNRTSAWVFSWKCAAYFQNKNKFLVTISIISSDMACPSWILAIFMPVDRWAVAYSSNIWPLKDSKLVHNWHIEDYVVSHLKLMLTILNVSNNKHWSIVWHCTKNEVFP